VPVTHAGEIEVTLVPGDTLVFVTDGLIERRGRSYDDGLTALIAALTPQQADLERYCDRLLDDLVAAPREDDVALLILRHS
jgi:serine phosphatase RsbU (regulator of sigma subunit)